MCPFGTSGLALDAFRVPSKWQVGTAQILALNSPSPHKRLEVPCRKRTHEGALSRLLGQEGACEPEAVSMGTSPSGLINTASRGHQPCPEPGLWAVIVPMITAQRVLR